MREDKHLNCVPKHKYKRLKNSQQLREKIWSELNISGSKLKQWITNPDEFVKNEKVEFDEFLKEKIEAGSKLEKFIFNLAKEKLAHLYKEFKTDKATYESLDYKGYVFANVDGFAWDIFNNLYIIEIKNTEVDDIDIMAEQYYYQMLFYCWFFNTRKCLFINFVKGWKLRYKIISFNDDELIECDASIREFVNYKKTGAINLKPKNKSNFNNWNDTPELQHHIDVIKELNEEIKTKTKKLELAKKRIKEYLEFENIPLLTSDGFYAKIDYRDQTKLDWDLFYRNLTIILGYEITPEQFEEIKNASNKKSIVKVLKINVGD